jgi:general secretion pathway protein I
MKRFNASAAAQGFTLLEVLVSTAILASVFVAVAGLASQSLRNIGRMNPQACALLHAREKMSEMLLLEELAPGERSGQWQDGYQWQVQVSPDARDAQFQDPASGLFRLRVVIRWTEQDRTKTYTVETIQWAKKAGQNAKS